MIAVGEDVDIVVFYACEVQLVEEGERVLEMDI